MNITIPSAVHFSHLGKFNGSRGSEVGLGFNSIPSIPLWYSATNPNSVEGTLGRTWRA